MGILVGAGAILLRHLSHKIIKRTQTILVETEQGRHFAGRVGTCVGMAGRAQAHKFIPVNENEQAWAGLSRQTGKRGSGARLHRICGAGWGLALPSLTSYLIHKTSESEKGEQGQKQRQEKQHGMA